MKHKEIFELYKSRLRVLNNLEKLKNLSLDDRISIIYSLYERVSEKIINNQLEDYKSIIEFYLLKYLISSSYDPINLMKDIDRFVLNEVMKLPMEYRYNILPSKFVSIINDCKQYITLKTRFLCTKDKIKQYSQNLLKKIQEYEIKFNIELKYVKIYLEKIYPIEIIDESLEDLINEKYLPRLLLNLNGNFNKIEEYIKNSLFYDFNA